MSGLSGARAAGFLAGLSLVAVLAVGVWTVPGVARPAVAGVDLRAVSTGEVGIEPGGSVLRTTALIPGGPAVEGRLRLVNRTAGPRLVRARAAGGDADLTQVVEVSLRAGGRLVYRGPLAGVAGGAIRLPRRGAVDLEVSARIPASAARAAAARTGRWTLTFEGG
jgi:hypothetical protein